MKITFLGTGTSDGVPVIGCNCEVCSSRDKRDNRTRTSIVINHNKKNYIVDTSLDFRYQLLREKIKNIECVFYTHHHADHTSGIVDLRALNFIMRKSINCYGNKPTMEILADKYDYFFNPVQRGGGLPQLNFHIVSEPFEVDGIKVSPIPVKHGILNIVGYRFNDFSYVTDASYISEKSLNIIKGSKVLVLNGLRYREHATHLSLRQAVNIADSLKIKKVYFTHITHDVLHRRLLKELPKNMKPAYDGLSFSIY